MSNECTDMNGNVQRNMQADAPYPECPADGRDAAGGVREVLDALASRPTRNAKTGQFISGLAAGKTLERSEIFWTAITPIKADLVTRVRTDLAHDDAPETVIGLTEAYAEVRLFRQAMFLRLADLGGPITTKGRSRALYTAYLSALDRETKLATTLGLTRKPKDAMTLDAYLQRRYGSQDAPHIAPDTQDAERRRSPRKRRTYAASRPR